MAAKKADGEPKPALVRKSLMVDADKLARARELLKLPSDADVLRLALDHLLAHFEARYGEEE
jgi:hypothetical protein